MNFNDTIEAFRKSFENMDAEISKSPPPVVYKSYTKSSKHWSEETKLPSDRQLPAPTPGNACTVSLTVQSGLTYVKTFHSHAGAKRYLKKNGVQYKRMLEEGQTKFVVTSSLTRLPDQ